MNPVQKQIAKAIVNIFETGSPHGNYGAVTVIPGDSGHLTYGRSQTTLSSGNLFLLIKAYRERDDAQFRGVLEPYLAHLETRDISLDSDPNLHALLREAGHDPAMRAEQDRFFDDHYFDPACTAAGAFGIATALGQTVAYDSFVQGGWSTVCAKVGTRPAPQPDGASEKAWIRRYVAARRGWLQSLKPPLPGTVYRMDAFDDLMQQQGAWELPFGIVVRGVKITEASLVADIQAPIVRASALEPQPRILRLTNPYMTGPDVQALQQSLDAFGFKNSADGVFGPFTDTLVRQFQSAKHMRVDGVVGPQTREELKIA